MKGSGEKRDGEGGGRYCGLGREAKERCERMSHRR